MVLLLVLAPSPSHGQESTQPELPKLTGAADASEAAQRSGRARPASMPLEEKLKFRGSLTLRNATLAEALFAVGEGWDVSIIHGKNLDGTVSGVFRNATLAEVLDSLLLANGYGYRARGDNLVVMTLSELGDSNAMLKSLSLSIPGGGEKIVPSVRLLLSPQGKAEPIPHLNLLVIRDLPEHLEKVKQFVTALPGVVSENAGPITPLKPPPAASEPAGNVPTAPVATVRRQRVSYFAPQYIKVQSLQAALEATLETARIAVVEDENRLLVVGDDATLELAKQVVQQLDKPRPQVRITAMIYDVSVEELERLGVNWTHGLKSSVGGNGLPRHSVGTHFGAAPTAASNFSVLDAATGAAASAASSPLMGATRLLTFNKYFDLNMILNALDQNNGARLLADPTVTVLDRENAQIKIVTEIPIQQLTQTSEGGAIGTTTFREAGVTLAVTPQIANDQTIQLQVTPTFSVLSGFNDGQPIIDSREATTKVRIANGQTLVIGGLRQRTETENKRGIPGIKDMKHVGALFRDHDTSVRESELLVFLRPEIVDACQVRVREQLTQEHIEATLSRLPVPDANTITTLPACRDKHCPLHAPRPKATALPGDCDPIGYRVCEGASWVMGGANKTAPAPTPPMQPGAPTAAIRNPTVVSQPTRLPSLSAAPGYPPPVPPNTPVNAAQWAPSQPSIPSPQGSQMASPTESRSTAAAGAWRRPSTSRAARGRGTR